MRIRKAMTTVAAGAALTLAGVAAPAAAAPAGTAAPTAGTGAARANCPGYVTWSDRSGPGGGDRRHVQCSGGTYVYVEIYCNTGGGTSPGFRKGYNKAECPGYGGRASGWSYTWN